MTIRNVKLKNRAGEYLQPYTENLPTASTSTAGKVKLDNSPTSGSNNAITSGAVHSALASINSTVGGLQSDVVNAQTAIGNIQTDVGNIENSISGINTTLGDKLDSSKLQVVNSKPASPNSSTFYFVKET